MVLVRAYPYESLICSVFVMQELHAFAVACCRAAQVLHDNKLVHCDLRLPNIVQLERGQHMVIDLESVASSAAKTLPKSFHRVLRTCTTEALNPSRCFTVLSDMCCVGLVMKEADSSFATLCSRQGGVFIQRLLDKSLTAAQASTFLKHDWCP